MKILLIQPNCAEEVNREFVSLQYPINLGYIASTLRNEGYEVKMIDFNVMNRNLLSSIISQFSPKVVGVTSMTSAIFNAKNIVSDIKKIAPKIKTILGGVHASALPLETMEEIKDLDYLVFGEGEETIKELLKYLSNSNKNSIKIETIKGIVFRKNNKIIKNKPRELIENIDSIPYPSRDLLPLTLYSKQHVSRGFSRKDMSIIEILTSRGCPNNCIFCAGHINYGYRVRFRSYENIIGEILECIEKYNINHISIEDDTFTLNKELVKKLCFFFKDKKLTWNCNARVNTVDYNLLKIMKESGCKKIAFGIESGNEEMLKKIKKGITIQQTISAVRNAKRAGIRYVECDFIIGSHIDETYETVKDSIKLIYRLMPDFLAISVMCPYPGTEIYNLMLSNNFMNKNPDWSQFSHFGELNRYDRLKYLNSRQMIKIQNRIMKDYYSSSKYIFNQLKQIKRLNEIKYFIRMGVLFLEEFVINKK